MDCDLGQSWGSLVSLSALVCPGPAGDMHLEGVSSSQLCYLLIELSVYRVTGSLFGWYECPYLGFF